MRLMHFFNRGYFYGRFERKSIQISLKLTKKNTVLRYERLKFWIGLHSIGGQLFFLHFSVALGLHFEKPSGGVITSACFPQNPRWRPRCPCSVIVYLPKFKTYFINNSFRSWSNSFIFYMCIADIYCKILSSLKYIKMLAVLAISVLNFGKYTITEQGHLGRHRGFWGEQAEVITPPDGFSKYRPRAIEKCKKIVAPQNARFSCPAPGLRPRRSQLAVFKISKTSRTPYSARTIPRPTLWIKHR